MERFQLSIMYLFAGLFGLTLLMLPGYFAYSQSSSGAIALPIITASPPPGYSYSVIQTIDTNTGKQVWMVYARPTFWTEYWKSIIGTLTTTVLAAVGWLFRSRLLALLGKGG